MESSEGSKSAGPWLRVWAPLVVVLAALVLGVAPNGAAKPGEGVSSISAASYAAIDSESGRVLVAHNARTIRPIASLTKVMTALVVIERGALNRMVRVAPRAVAVEDYREGLVAGDRYSRITLLRSALIVSANDSATALAIEAGGGSLRRFYGLMNARARSIGMEHTTYASASGLDDERNLSTALDQALLTREALKSPILAAIVRTRKLRTAWPAPTYAKVWVNHNKMLFTTPGTYGVKTGWTTRAGGCLIIAQRRGGRSVIGVVLASENIWSDMSVLLDAAFRRV